MTFAPAARAAGFKKCCMRSGLYDGNARDHTAVECLKGTDGPMLCPSCVHHVGLMEVGWNFVLHERRIGRILTVGAFIDESGNDGHSPVMVLSALVANVERWESFSDDWQAELAAPPKVKCFKSYDAAKCEGYFDGFTREQAEAKTDRLASVVLRHIEYGIVELVYTDEFDEIIKGQLYRPTRRLAREMKDPYFLLFYGLVKNVIREQLSRKAKVDFTFDDYNKIGRKCLRRINEGHFTRLLPDGYKDLIGRAIPGKDEEFLPLQAADLVAGQYRRFLSSVYSWSARNPVHLTSLASFGHQLEFRDFEPSTTIAKLWESKKIQKGPIDKEEMKALVAYINITWSVVVLSKIKAEREAKTEAND